MAVSPWFRSVMLIPFIGGLLMASLPITAGQAHEQAIDPSAAGDKPLAAAQADAESRPLTPLFDPTARIKYLHDRLRIAAEQEPLWDAVAQTMRENARAIVPLLRERYRSKTSGSALEILHAYEALGESQLDNLKKFNAAFGALSASFTDNQKKIAQAIFHESPLSTMVGGIPEVPAPFGPPLSDELALPYYVPLLSSAGARVFLHRSGHFEHIHGVIAPGRVGFTGSHVGTFHR